MNSKFLAFTSILVFQLLQALTSEETEEYRKMFISNNYRTQETSMNKNNFPTKSQKEEVEKFLRESYNNMHMSSNTSNAPNGIFYYPLFKPYSIE